MTDEEKRAIARAIAKQQTNNNQERKHLYLVTLSDLGLKSDCCREGICGDFPTETSLFR